MRYYTTVRTEEDFNRSKKHLPFNSGGRPWNLEWSSVESNVPVAFYYTEDDRWGGWDRLHHAERGNATRKDLLVADLPDELFRI